ncbi:pseudoazurin [Geminicoccus flavidas]|uniref:pseudoazurin n=1 Tax=Geminicoccus flavidas TaxID=2506407 RepID=UPI00135B7E12|nr:pseudoazurin [Geminicoccus flavidas]
MTAGRLLLAAAILILATGPGRAEVIEVRMLNRGLHGSMVFEPDYVELRPGDTLQFRVGHRSHNAASIDGMVPDGHPGFKGQIDEEIAVALDQPGIYGIKCSPHFGMGMVMLVRVGEVELPAEIQDANLPGRARKRFAEILERALRSNAVRRKTGS